MAMLIVWIDILKYDIRSISYWNNGLGNATTLCGSMDQNNKLDELDPNQTRWKVARFEYLVRHG